MHIWVASKGACFLLAISKSCSKSSSYFSTQFINQFLIDLVPSKPSIGIEKPRIEQRGVRTIVYWNVGGDTSLIVAYQVISFIFLYLAIFRNLCFSKFGKSSNISGSTSHWNLSPDSFSLGCKSVSKAVNRF